MSYTLIDIEQGSDAWKTLRRTKVGASDIGILMEGTDKEIYQLWESKVLGKEKYVTAAMQRGTDREDDARRVACKAFQRDYRKSCAVSDKHEWLMASLDGYDMIHNESLEIKTPAEFPTNPQEFSGYKKAWWQIQAHHAVYSPERAILMIYNPNDDDFHIEEIEADDKAIEKLIAKGKWFWDLVQSMTPPTITIERADEDWSEAEAAYVQALRELKEAEEKAAICKESLIYLAGDKSVRGQKVSLCKYFRKGAVDYTRIPELVTIDLERYRKPPLEMWKITVL